MKLSFKFVLLLSIIFQVSQSRILSIKIVNSKPELFDYKVQNFLAFAEYNESMETTGWDQLYVETNPSFSLKDQLYFAGFLEGYLTAYQITSWTHNIFSSRQDEFDILEDYLTIQIKKIEQMENNLESMLDDQSYTFWKKVILFYHQLRGVFDGYWKSSEQKIDWFTMEVLFFINEDGVTSELALGWQLRKMFLNAIQIGEYNQENYFSFVETQQIEQMFLQSSDFFWLKRMKDLKQRCSVLIKPIFEESHSYKKIADVLVGHTTWESYSEMNRFLKYYNFPNLMEISMSSYPGCISSTDEWYIIKKSGADRLFVTETTLSVVDQHLYERYFLDPEDSIVNFLKIMTANALARDAKEWIYWMEFILAGSYSSQWMIINLDQILEDYNQESFMVLEQIPGSSYYEDATSYLKKYGYWGSYNYPGFDVTAEVAGYVRYKELYKNIYDGDTNPRAKIIREYIEDINSIQDIKWFMQLNTWQVSDLLQFDDPGNAISARYDLSENQVIKNPFGGTDSKVGNIKSLKKLAFWAISGPTHQDHEPFTWADFPEVLHEGQPEIFDFDWMEYKIE